MVVSAINNVRRWSLYLHHLAPVSGGQKSPDAAAVHVSTPSKEAGFGSHEVIFQEQGLLPTLILMTAKNVTSIAVLSFNLRANININIIDLELKGGRNFFSTLSFVLCTSFSVLYSISFPAPVYFIS